MKTEKIKTPVNIQHTFVEVKSGGLERYPEFTPLVTHLTRMVASEAEAIIPSIQSDMPYKMQFVLEEVIKKLQTLV